MRRRLLEWPDGPKLFEHLRDLEGPLRLEDFSGFLSSFGFSAELMPFGTVRGERQARAGLEALVETSPVGVLVFDAATGRPVSINGEARRILEGLRLPERPLEELMGVVTCRFAERREVALQDCPIGRALSLAETRPGRPLRLHRRRTRGRSFIIELLHQPSA